MALSDDGSRTRKSDFEYPICILFCLYCYLFFPIFNSSISRKKTISLLHQVLGHPAGHPQQPQTPRLNASGTATGGAGGPGPGPTNRRATTPGAGGVITPGSNFDASEVDRYVFCTRVYKT